MLVRQIFDEKLAQFAYLIGCPRSGTAIVVDPERDIDRYFDLADRNGLTITAAVDTHIHADYLTGLREFAERGVKVYGSDEGGTDWRYEWLLDSNYDYQLLKDGDRFKVGNIEFEAVHTPGHTPEHMSYLVYDRGSGAEEPIGMITGDFVFVGDLGRPDLLETAAGQKGTMEKSARILFGSIEKFRRVPEFVQVWPAHGAGSACGKALGDIPLSTVGYELRHNASIQAASSEENFVQNILTGQPEPPLYFARMKRDNKLGPRVLGSLPRPARLTTNDLAHLAGRRGVVVVDAREDRSAFMAHHLKGAIYAPYNNTFPTITGSYVEENMPIYLIIEEDHLEDAVRDLVRIGLDNVAGFATPETFERYRLAGGAVESTDEIDFQQVRGMVFDEDYLVLDVRGIAEYEAAHVPNALNIAHTRLVPRMNEIPKGKTLLVHCRSGARAAAAASFLEHAGFPVKYVSDRFDNWMVTARETEEEVAF